MAPFNLHCEGDIAPSVRTRRDQFEAANRAWGIDLSHQPTAARLLVCNQTRYGYGRASYELNLGCNYEVSISPTSEHFSVSSSSMPPAWQTIPPPSAGTTILPRRPVIFTWKVPFSMGVSRPQQSRSSQLKGTFVS